MKKLLCFLLGAMFFASCGDDKDEPEIQVPTLYTQPLNTVDALVGTWWTTDEYYGGFFIEEGFNSCRSPISLTIYADGTMERMVGPYTFAGSYTYGGTKDKGIITFIEDGITEPLRIEYIFEHFNEYRLKMTQKLYALENPTETIYLVRKEGD